MAKKQKDLVTKLTVIVTMDWGTRYTSDQGRLGFFLRLSRRIQPCMQVILKVVAYHPRYQVIK
jgi:hypothetical protein